MNETILHALRTEQPCAVVETALDVTAYALGDR